MRLALLAALVFSCACENKLKALPADFPVPEDINRAIETKTAGEVATVTITYPNKKIRELPMLGGLDEAGWTYKRLDHDGPGALYFVEKGEVATNVMTVDIDSGGAKIIVTVPATVRPPGAADKPPAIGTGVVAVDAGATATTATTEVAVGGAIETSNAGAKTYFTDLLARCEGGDEGSECWLLGVAFERGLGGVAKDEARAAALYAKGCQPPTRAGGCVDHYKRQKSVSDKQVGFLAKLCQLGRPDACKAVLAALDGRRVKAVSSKKVRASACEAGLLDVCLALKKPPANASKAKKLRAPRRASKLAKAAIKRCNKRIGYACGLVALSYNGGLNGLKENKTKAIDIGARACNDKTQWGCYPSAAALFSVAKTPQRMASALKIAELGCDRLESNSCDMLAQVYESDDSQPALRTRALSYRLMNCHLGLPERADPCAAFETSVTAYPKAVPRR